MGKFSLRSMFAASVWLAIALGIAGAYVRSLIRDLDSHDEQLKLGVVDPSLWVESLLVGAIVAVLAFGSLRAMIFCWLTFGAADHESPESST